MKPISIGESLAATRARAKETLAEKAAAAAQPAPAASEPEPALLMPSAWPDPDAVVVPPEPEVPGPLKQCNVRLTPLARERIRSTAAACQVTEQELIERWARTLPAMTAPAAPMPWER